MTSAIGPAGGNGHNHSSSVDEYVVPPPPPPLLLPAQDVTRGLDEGIAVTEERRCVGHDLFAVGQHYTETQPA